MAVKMLVFLAFLLILGGVQKVSGENVTNTTSSAERIDNTTAQEQQPSVAPVVGDNDFSPSKSAEADGVQFSLPGRAPVNGDDLAENFLQFANPSPKKQLLKYLKADLSRKPFTLFDEAIAAKRLRCQSEDGAFLPGATSCDDELGTEACETIFEDEHAKIADGRPKNCNNPEMGDLSMRCAKTCKICCETKKFNCVDSGSPLINCREHIGKCGDPVWHRIMRLACEHTCGTCDLDKCFDSAPGCGSFKPLCRDPDFGSSIQEQCSLTCGACSLKPVVAPSSIISNNSTISVKKTGKELVVIVRQPSNIELECKDIAKTCEDNKYLCDNPRYQKLMTEKCALTCGHCKETSEVSTVRRILDRAAKVAAKSEAEEIVKKPLQNILTTRRVQIIPFNGIGRIAGRQATIPGGLTLPGQRANPGGPPIPQVDVNEVNVAEKKDGANKVKQKSDSSLEKETKELDDLVERLRGEEDSANKTNNSTTTGKQTPERSIRGEIKSLKKHGRKHGKSSKDKANTGRARTDPIVLLVSGESQDGSTVENDLDLGALQYQYGQQNQLSSIEEGNGVYAGDQEQPSKNEEQEDQQLPESKEQQDSSGESVANAQIPGPKNGDALKTDDETELEIDVEQAQGKPEEIVENAHQIPESENEDIPTNDEKEVELVVEQEAPERPETRINDTNQDKKDEETEGQSNDEDSQRENEDNELEEKANDEQIKDVRDVQDVEDIVVDEEEPQQQFRRRRSTAYEPKTLEQFDLDGSERDEKVVSLRQGFRFGQNSADPPTKTLLQRFIAEKEDGDKTFEQFDLDGRERESDRVVALRQGFRLGQTLDDNHKKPSHENDEKELKTFEEFNLDGSEREPLRVTTFKEDFRLGPSLEKPPDDSSINEDKNGTASEKPINEGESVRVAALRQFFRLGQGLDDPPDRNDSSLSTTIQENEWKILTLRGNNSEEEIVGEDNDVIDFIEGHLGDQKTTANENASELIGANNVSEAIPKLNGSVGTESEKLDKLLHDEVNSNTTANYEEEGTVDQVWQQYQRRFEGMHNLQNSGENLNQENNSEVFAAKEAPQMRGSDAGDMFGDNQLLNSEISEEDGINFAGAQTNPNIWTAADQNDIEEDVVANDSETENPIFFANNNNVKTEVVDDDDKKIVEGREGNQVEESQPAKTVEPDKNQADDDADDNTEEKLSKLLLKALGGAKRVKGSNKTKVIRLKLTSAGQPRKSPLSGGNKIASKVSRPQIPKTKVPSKRNKPAEDDFVDENPNKETDGGKVVEEISNYDDTEAENTKKKLPNKPKESATYSNSDLKGLKNVTKSLANTLEGSQGAIVNELHAILLELKAIRHHYYGDRNDSNNEELKKFLMNKHEQSSSNKHTGHRSVKNGDKSDSGELYGNKARRHSVARRETKDGSNKRTKFEPHRGNIRKVAGSNSEEAGDEGNTDPAEEERVKTSNSQKNLEAVSNVVTTGGFQIIPIELNKKRPETRSNILTYEPRQYVRTAQQTDDQSNINGNPYRRIPLTIIRVNPQIPVGQGLTSSIQSYAAPSQYELQQQEIVQLQQPNLPDQTVQPQIPYTVPQQIRIVSQQQPVFQQIPLTQQTAQQSQFTAQTSNGEYEQVNQQPSIYPSYPELAPGRFASRPLSNQVHGFRVPIQKAPRGSLTQNDSANKLNIGNNDFRPIPSEKCRDYYPYCEKIVPNGFCTSDFFPLRMKREFCPQSCGVC